MCAGAFLSAAPHPLSLLSLRFLLSSPKGNLLLLFVINEVEEFSLHGILQYSHIVIFLHW
jgi:hypothetical protein